MLKYKKATVGFAMLSVVFVVGLWLAQAQEKKPEVKAKAPLPKEPSTVESPKESTTNEVWVNIFPIGAHTYGLWQDAQDTSTLYTATYLGLFKSVNAGMYWVPISPSVANAEWIDFAQCPNSPQIMYLSISGRWGGKVLRSSDRGLTWEDISAGVIKGDVSNITSDPNNQAVLYVVSGGELFKTLNSGKTWGKITPEGLSGEIQLSVNPANPQNLVLISHNYPSAPPLQMSSDGGLTWLGKKEPVQIYPFGPADQPHDVDWWTFVAFHRRNGNLLLGLAGANGWPPPSLIVSQDGGDTWADVSIRNIDENGLSTTPKNISSLEWGDQTGRIIYAGTTPTESFRSQGSTGLFVTSDGGRTWRQLLPNVVQSVAAINQRTLFAATPEGIFKSIDAGESWHRANLGIPVQLWAPDTDPYLSNITEFNWGKISGTLLECVDNTGTIYVGSSGGYWTSKDGGLSWDFRAIDSDGNVRQITLTNDGTLYLNLVETSGYFREPQGKILKVAPGGGSVEVKTGGQPELIAISPIEPRVIYSTTSEALMVSEDGGFSWLTIDLRRWFRPGLERFGVISSIPILKVGYSSPKTAYLVVDISEGGLGGNHETVLLATTDGGTSWRDIFPSLKTTMRKLRTPGDFGPVTSLVLNPKESKSIYVTTVQGVFRSTDGGASWFGLTPSNFQGRINDIALSPSSTNVLYLASEKGILRSTDAGRTWQNLNRGLLGDEAIDKLIASPSGVFAQGQNGIYRLSDDHFGWALKAWQELEKINR